MTVGILREKYRGGERYIQKWYLKSNFAKTHSYITLRRWKMVKKSINTALKKVGVGNRKERPGKKRE